MVDSTAALHVAPRAQPGPSELSRKTDKERIGFADELKYLERDLRGKGEKRGGKRGKEGKVIKRGEIGGIAR